MNHEVVSSSLTGQTTQNNDESPFLKEEAIFYWGRQKEIIAPQSEELGKQIYSYLYVEFF